VRSTFDPNRISFMYALFQFREIGGRFAEKERTDFSQEVEIVADTHECGIPV